LIAVSIGNIVRAVIVDGSYFARVVFETATEASLDSVAHRKVGLRRLRDDQRLARGRCDRLDVNLLPLHVQCHRAVVEFNAVSAISVRGGNHARRRGGLWFSARLTGLAAGTIFDQPLLGLARGLDADARHALLHIAIIVVDPVRAVRHVPRADCTRAPCEFHAFKARGHLRADGQVMLVDRAAHLGSFGLRLPLGSSGGLFIRMRLERGRLRCEARLFLPARLLNELSLRGLAFGIGLGLR